MRADPNQVKTLYDSNGFLTEMNILDKKELDEASNHYEKLEEKFGKEYTQYSLHNAHMQYEWVMSLAVHPNLLEVITAVLGPNIILLDSRFICKYSSTDVPHKNNTVPYVAWHQDIKYWGFEGGPVASVWLAFDNVDTENGVLQVIPGSHKQGILEHRSAEIPGNMLTANQEIPRNLVREEESVACPLTAGQMSVHDGLTVHASEPNMSSRRRCGFVIRYVPTTAYPVEDPVRPRSFPATVLVSGTDEFHHFQDHAPNFFLARNIN
ncbi:putative alpha-ketoglutarate-dependent hypophosphite dioxygenase isoform X1 [Ascaphus truei]|uniref:putative alpha-ketoglutarate-dependent hypophosphite dioxygenase isoform X1 n=2 Tax=Ascaphus truei TaxID=8439 RepID=UPI003F59772E